MARDPLSSQFAAVDAVGHAAAVIRVAPDLLTYWPSEFSQIRGQYRRTTYAEGNTASEFLFQFLFAIGAHGAHTF